MKLSLLGTVAAGFAGWRLARRTRHFLHLFQLEGYKPHEYKVWLKKHPKRVRPQRSHKLGAGVLAGSLAMSKAVSPRAAAALALPAWALSFISSKPYRSDQQKKPLAFTPRMKRLIGASAALSLVPIAAGAAVGARKGSRGVPALLAGFGAADLAAPATVLGAGLLLAPFERRVHEGFKAEARAKLAARPDLRTIGITGSYGKTSTKFAVAELLRQRYSVLATPGSYNTPMGLSLVANQKLKREHQLLVLEYGIRYPGDMVELGEVARPDIAVVTTIGVAHLETMGSQDRIAQEKGGLLDLLPEDGEAVLNVDDERVAAMAERAPGKVWRVSVEGREDADVVARDVTYTRGGARFVIRDDTGAEATFETRLLGRHNVLNIALAVAVGRACGLRLRQMAHAARRLTPVEHRLQLRQDGPVTVIDDAFNSNPVGARNAVELLGGFEADRRAIVTPGMIELGPQQEELNRAFGRQIAEHLTQPRDLVVLVGERQTRPIQQGLRDAGYPEERLHVVGSLFEAQDLLKRELGEGDVVLYENDLPDQYGE